MNSDTPVDTVSRPTKMLFWFMAFFAMHMVVRAMTVVDLLETLMFSNIVPWLRGVTSDLLMALALAGFTTWLGRKKWWMSHVFFGFWAFALAGNREYISEWSANISVLDIAGLFDPEFIEGSVLTVRLFVTACILAMFGQAAYIIVQWVAGREPVLSRRAGDVFLILPLVAFLLPANPPDLWIQQNLLEDNLRQVGDALVPDGGSKPSPASVSSARRFMAAMHRQDLKGELIVTPSPDINVLIINIESLSDNILRRGWMPYLKQLSENALYYPQYILPNLVTVRGMYAQFCGEATYWGRFGRDNMAAHIRKDKRRCLPDVLTEQGYYTVYMQAAGLHFQNKIRVIPATGFMEVLGRNEMDTGDRFSDWGLDDESLFENARKKIEKIEVENIGAPWMISLLTVGTHHPYGVDPSFRPELPLRERSFTYADSAIQKMIEWLQKTKRLERTLVVITGDESREHRRSRSGVGGSILRNQGLLVVLTPEGDKKRIDEPFMQTDLPISILDYAVMDIPPGIGGRSIFRHYDAFRPLAFGNYTQQAVYALWKPGELTRCQTAKWQCDLFKIGDKTLFDPETPFKAERTVSNPTRALYEENQRHWLGR